MTEAERLEIGRQGLAACRAALDECTRPGWHMPTPVEVPLLREPDDGETNE